MKQGKALEQIEKAIQEHLNCRSNVEVESNAKLKDVWGIEREIDVFVYATNPKEITGIAFECRDHKRKVGLFEIDSFIGKYHDLPQIKKIIVVSTSGFTKDAQHKAEKYNIGLHTIENVPYEEILKCFDVYRLLDKIEVRLPYYIVLEESDKMLPYYGQKVYNAKDDTQVLIRIDWLSALLERQSSIHEQLSSQHTNRAEITCAFIPSEKWYILDSNNTKQVIKEFCVIVHVTMNAQLQDITEQKFDVASSVRISEWKQTDVDDLVLVQNDQKYSVFRKDKDGNINRANVVPQYSI